MNQNPNQQPDYPKYEPWDQGVYRTGMTRHHKKHWGLIAVLLTLVILLAGLSTILGLVNIRLLGQIRDEKAQASAQIHFSDTPEGAEDPFSAEDQPTTATIAATIPAQTEPITIVEGSGLPEDEQNTQGLSLQDIYDKVIHSVVSISCSNGSTGTGVILSADGYIVTNCHVVEGAQSVQVLLTDGRQILAELVGKDGVSDLAVLRIAAQDLQPAQLGDSGILRVGDSVVAIGDPLGIALRGTMTDGIISAINRDIDVGGRSMNLIQTNAALNSGNSGGPLINRFGQVIGINTMKMGNSLTSASVEGLGFAIPSTTVQQIVNQLILQGYVSGRPSLGIAGQAVSSFDQLYYRLPQGLRITEVVEGSCAEKAGLIAGDIVLSIDDQQVTDEASLKTILYNYEPGDEIAVVIFRSGRRYAGDIVLDEAGS